LIPSSDLPRGRRPGRTAALLSTILMALLVGCTGPTIIEQPDHIGNYNISFSIDPQLVRPPQHGTLNYGITDAKTGKPVNSFDAIYGTPIHNVIFSRDLTVFRHTYTSQSLMNEFSMPAEFPQDGRYYSYTMFKPTGADLQVLTGTMQFDNAGPEPELVADADRAKLSFGSRFELLTGSGPIRAGQPRQLAIYVTERGNPVTALWPFLDAPGYLWVIGADGNDFGVETGASENHPYLDNGSPGQASPPPTLVPDLQAALSTRTAEPVSTLLPVQLTSQASVLQTPGVVVPSVGYGPAVVFTHTFPRAGFYKIWAEMQYRAHIIQVGWLLKVEP
jgi:hypothetical protein